MIYNEKFNECHRTEDDSFPLNTFIFTGDSPPHWHDYMEFLYCMRGSYFIMVEENKIYCHQGELVMINTKVPHKTFSLEEDAMLQVLHISPSLLYSYLNNDTYFGRYMALLSGKVKFVQKYDCREKEIHRFFEELLEEYNRKDNTYELRCVAYVLLILSHLIRSGCISFEDMDTFKREELEKLRPALEYLKENYMQGITLREISDVVFLSKSAFCKLFRDVMRMTFKEYLNELRLTEAKKLLIAESHSITYIANEVGYPSVNYFNRVFREKTGTTPTGFRHEYKRNSG